jgi:hypothetical protein
LRLHGLAFPTSSHIVGPVFRTGRLGRVSVTRPPSPRYFA